jgi:protein-S-isoprenylcysteine O-methyltransferase Ste14
MLLCSPFTPMSKSLSNSRSTDRPDIAHVIAPPPIIFLGALALGLALQAVWPLPLFAHGIVARLVGGCLILGGLTLSGAVMYHFGRAGTPVIPWRETRRLVVSGPYRFSRNPDYVGQALIVGGLGLLLALPWVLPALVLALLVVRYGVIAREERYLERRFGDEYRGYRGRVRRWL